MATEKEWLTWDITEERKEDAIINNIINLLKQFRDTNRANEEFEVIEARIITSEAKRVKIHEKQNAFVSRKFKILRELSAAVRKLMAATGNELHFEEIYLARNR